MISVGTLLHISDNSGASTASCIKVLGTTPKQKGTPGNILVVTLKKVKSNKKVNPHQIKKAILMATTYPVRKSNGVIIRFQKNSIILIDDRFNPIANRINQYVLSNFRLKNYMKIVSISFGML